MNLKTVLLEYNSCLKLCTTPWRKGRCVKMKQNVFFNISTRCHLVGGRERAAMQPQTEPYIKILPIISHFTKSFQLAQIEWRLNTMCPSSRLTAQFHLTPKLRVVPKFYLHAFVFYIRASYSPWLESGATRRKIALCRIFPRQCGSVCPAT